MKQNKLLDIFNRADEEVSFTAYSEYIKCLLNRGFWKNGPSENAKIPWESARKARNSNPDEFKRSGLYLWGGESYPVYVGKTKKTFKGASKN